MFGNMMADLHSHNSSFLMLVLETVNLVREDFVQEHALYALNLWMKFMLLLFVQAWITTGACILISLDFVLCVSQEGSVQKWLLSGM